jgi:hypothetical protein
MDNISNETHVALSGGLGGYSLSEQGDKLSIFFPTGVILGRRRRQAGDVKYICVLSFLLRIFAITSLGIIQNNVLLTAKRNVQYNGR